MYIISQAHLICLHDFFSLNIYESRFVLDCKYMCMLKKKEETEKKERQSLYIHTAIHIHECRHLAGTNTGFHLLTRTCEAESFSYFIHGHFYCPIYLPVNRCTISEGS
eukprot:GHVU01012046.1.p1 GENE.GHVU01012046.1~~GHVU01012046.1.p1  ORF type:complete len:108 (+),score=2.22 GHVU01012046.1:181-504(+)